MVEDETQNTQEEEEVKDEKDSSFSDMTQRAELAADRLEASMKKQEEMLERQERLAVEARYSGKAEAGQVPVEKKKETPKEYAERALKGEV